MPRYLTRSPFTTQAAPFGRVTISHEYVPYRYSGTKFLRTETSTIRARRFANELLALCDQIDATEPLAHPLPVGTRVIALIPMRIRKSRMSGKVVSFDENTRTYGINVSIVSDHAVDAPIPYDDVCLDPYVEDQS